MSFIDWISRFKDKDTPNGDLAADILADKRFPSTNDRVTISDYLSNRGACDGAIRTFKTAWKSYQAYLRRHQ